MINSDEKNQLGLIWNYYKPRRTHTWNMLVLSWRELEAFDQLNFSESGEIPNAEYSWENYILRLWIFRNAISTLAKLPIVHGDAKTIIDTFDQVFISDGQNGLRAIRNMIEHFDDYAAGTGRGPAIRDRDLDPWREVSNNIFERGKYKIVRTTSYNAAIKLRSDADTVSNKFIQWLNENTVV